MYEKIHSKFTEQELNEIRALAIKFEEKYKANVTKRTLSLNYSSWSKKNLSNHIITYFKKFFRFHLKSEARV